jgi:hypothetical protein
MRSFGICGFIVYMAWIVSDEVIPSYWDITKSMTSFRFRFVVSLAMTIAAFAAVAMAQKGSVSVSGLVNTVTVKAGDKLILISENGGLKNWKVFYDYNPQLRYVLEKRSKAI